MPDSQKQLAPTESRRKAASVTLTHGSLFTGVGGIDLGLGWAGFNTVWQVERDPFALKVLEKRWAKVPKFTDVRQCGKHNLERVDIISGGFPCQDESMGGKKRGFGTPENPTKRSGLWFQYLRIIRELRPHWVLIENVSRLLHTEDGDRVLAGMEGAGYSCSPLLLEAEILGAPHKRERTWILCHDNARGRCDFEAVTAGQWALPPRCQQKIEEARETWNYWKHELSGGTEHESSALTITPTATAILVNDWSEDSFIRQPTGRWRKRTKSGKKEGSMSWFQEMAVRAAAQENPKLIPTPEACEEFMGFPKGWTDLGRQRPEAVAYARILRGVQGMPDCKKRLKAMGNAVVPLIPMLFGCFIQQYESRIALRAHAAIHES